MRMQNIERLPRTGPAWYRRALVLVVLAVSGAVAGPSDGAAQGAASDADERGDGPYIVVSIDDRRLWLVEGGDTLLSAPAAVGMEEPVELQGRRFEFSTPRGERRVLKKERDPQWTPPDWHYYEKAEARGLELVELRRGVTYPLSDDTYLDIRDDQVGRVNRFGNWWPYTPGTELIYDGKLFMPPFGTAQRTVPYALGAFKLDMGDGYLIHGTNPYNDDSIGQAVSHGCVRLENDDLATLYEAAAVGMPVYIR